MDPSQLDTGTKMMIKAIDTAPISPAKQRACLRKLKKLKTRTESNAADNKGGSTNETTRVFIQIRHRRIPMLYLPVIPLIPSIKFHALMIPVHKIRATAIYHTGKPENKPQSVNISNIAEKWNNKRMRFGTECISSAKLIKVINVKPAKNHE